MSEGDNTSVYIYNGVGGVPNDVTHVRVDPSVTIIPREAFQECRDLEEVELPKGLMQIESNAFNFSKSLISINIPSTVEEIGDHAFDHCVKLDGITLPEGLQRLGDEAFASCQSLQRINIPSSINTIGYRTFCHCHSLIDVVFSDGLREIKEDAFSRCRSLVSVTLPSSLKVIGTELFEGCKLLNEVHMHDTIETIQPRAFKDCNFTNFRMSPLISDVVDISIVGGNASLVSLELPETAGHFKDNFNSTNELYTKLSVRNIALPSECVIDVNALALKYCKELEMVFPDADEDTISDALKHRFDDLPIHKICYYQSYSDNEITLQHLKREINPWTSKPAGQLNTTGEQHDCLGMTPLHILACSTKPTIEMYRLLIEKYPETLTMKDKWGGVPLLYALWCNTPTEVVDLLVTSYKSLHPDYDFNWGRMLETLAKCNVPLANIQKLVNTQQNIFPDQKYDMQGIVLVIALYDTSQASFNKPCTAVDTFQYLLRISIAERLESLAIRRWSVELKNVIISLPKIAKCRYTDTQAVFDRLATYESIKEGTSILELALWKAKIDEVRNKRPRVGGDVSYKEQCRINCGADIIIRNVLPYMLPE